VNRNLQQLLTELESLLRSVPLATHAPPGGSPSSAALDPGSNLLALLAQSSVSQTAFADSSWIPSERSERSRETADSFLEPLNEALARAKAIVESPVCPIIAVLGMLNAGKSSLVATFLSDAVRAPADGAVSEQTVSEQKRVLIGSANAEGTHRFVLWLPESWKSHTVIWGYLSQQFRQVFGCDGEVLSDDPVEAARQYNAIEPQYFADAAGQKSLRHPIDVPLIATDPKLDQLGIALMDCPDVQTGLMNRGMDIPRHSARFEEASASVAESRFAVLQKASSLCSAFMVVLPANAMHDQTVSKLLRMLEARMPHVQRLLAVNRVPRRYLVREIGDEVQQLYPSANLRRVYMAYNFDGPHHRERLPPPPEDFPHVHEPPLPLFFRIDSDPALQPPCPIPDSEWMIRLGSQLEGNTLLSDAIRSAVATLSVQTSRSISRASQWVQEQNQRSRDVHQVIADACLDFSIDPASAATNPRLRLQASRKIVQQIANSLEKTAPWWAKPGRWVQRIASASKQSVGQATSWLRMPDWVNERGNSVGQWIRGRFHRGETGRVITADALCDHLAKRDRQGILGIDDQSLQREIIRDACQRAIDRFQVESATQLDQTQIDALTQRMWDEMPVGKRVISSLAPAGILFAPLLAVIMVPLDFGGSAVLVFASLKELLFAGAAGVGLVLASSDSMPHLAESESAWQQLMDLVAIVTDELGIASPDPDRPIRVQLGSSTKNLSSSSLPSKRNERPDAPGGSLVVRYWNSGTEEMIRNCLEAMERAQN
jgi:hypothetical protein